MNAMEKLKELMKSGQMYNDRLPELDQYRNEIAVLTEQYNASFGKSPEERQTILRRMLKSIGHNVHFQPGFRCEFGWNITIGDDFFANFDCFMFDAAEITIGNHVQIGPRVGIYTSNHAFDARERNQGACYAKAVTIGDNVWIGGGVIINQGVRIGENSIIGSGSVVTKDIPANVVAAGVPCKVIRSITEADKTNYIP